MQQWSEETNATWLICTVTAAPRTFEDCPHTGVCKGGHDPNYLLYRSNCSVVYRGGQTHRGTSTAAVLAKLATAAPGPFPCGSTPCVPSPGVEDGALAAGARGLDHNGSGPGASIFRITEIFCSLKANDRPCNCILSPWGSLR